MDPRLEALLGIVTVVVLFVPIFVAIFVALPTGEQMRTARERRLVAYRKSPDSQLLRLNDVKAS